jgi:hypothetical protein
MHIQARHVNKTAHSGVKTALKRSNLTHQLTGRTRPIQIPRGRERLLAWTQREASVVKDCLNVTSHPTPWTMHRPQYRLIDTCYWVVHDIRVLDSPIVITMQISVLLCRTWGSPSGGYEEAYLLWYNAVWSVDSQLTFRRNMSSSGSRNNPNKKPAWSG